LKPGNPDGAYTQEVPLAGIISEPAMTLNADGKDTKLNFPDDYVASSARLQSETGREPDIVFVGYGIVAGVWLGRLQRCRRARKTTDVINDPAIPI
jgi:hypothetical protein